jgi:hypothetical protein
VRGGEKKSHDRKREAKVLPTREALSLISTGKSAYSGEDAGASDPSKDTESNEPAGRHPDTDAESSGGGEESVAGNDRRSETAPPDRSSGI